MSFVDTYLPEFDHEMSGTQSILERVPDSLLAWKAHPTLNSISWVASHIAETPSWMEPTLNAISFDVAPVGGQAYQTKELESSQEIVDLFDKNVAHARSLVASASDELVSQPWTLLKGGVEVFTMPRAALMKSIFINHVIHHRAFLVAYLRMNDVKCPPLYG